MQSHSVSLSASLGTTYEIGAPPPPKSLVERILHKWSLQATAKEIFPEHRVSICFRNVRPDHQGVKVWKTPDAAHYSGLMVCGSVWVCPVCASKISERRRNELQESERIWKERGGSVYLLTLTLPHYASQKLNSVLSTFQAARKLMMHRKAWKTLKRQFKIAGSVRALEVTHGENGWHVHSHEIIYSELPEINQSMFQARVYELWATAVEDCGWPSPSEEHGVDVQGEGEVSKYAGKWGMDCEVSKAHIKRGHEGHFTPFDFLRLYQAGHEKYGELFREYAKEFKGKRQLVWSEGLRDLLGLGAEITDEQVASAVQAEAVLLGELSKAQWRLVLAADRRGELLYVASSQGWDGVLKLIRLLAGPPDERIGYDVRHLRGKSEASRTANGS